MSRLNSNGAPCDASKVKKIFVGGLAPTVDETALREYFQRFGDVEDAVVMYDPHSSRPRGFGFITFCDVSSVDHVFLCGVMQELHDKQIEIKRAVPREDMAPPRRTRATPPPQSTVPLGNVARMNGYNSAPLPDYNSSAFVSGLLQGSLAGQQLQQQQAIWGNAPPPPPIQQNHLLGLQHQAMNVNRFAAQSQGSSYSNLTAGLAAAGPIGRGNSAVSSCVTPAVSLPLGLNLGGADDYSSGSLSHSHDSFTGGGSAGSGMNPGNFSLISFPDRGFLGQEYSGGSSLPDGLIDSSYMAGGSSGFGSLGFSGMGTIGGTAF
jgi:RNA recognition motif-containing protein